MCDSCLLVGTHWSEIEASSCAPGCSIWSGSKVGAGAAAMGWAGAAMGTGAGACGVPPITPEISAIGSPDVDVGMNSSTV